VRPTNKTNMAAKSEAEKTRERLIPVEREIDREGKEGSNLTRPSFVPATADC
jgi:hypothetical protein